MGRREEVESRRRGKERSVLIKQKLVFFRDRGTQRRKKKKILVSIHLLGEWADARRRRRRRRKKTPLFIYLNARRSEGSLS